MPSNGMKRSERSQMSTDVMTQTVNIIRSVSKDSKINYRTHDRYYKKYKENENAPLSVGYVKGGKFSISMMKKNYRNIYKELQIF